MSEPTPVPWSGIHLASPATFIVLGLNGKPIPWPWRLWAVVTLPYQLARFVVTGRFEFCRYKQ